jgi:hypothetical protein
MQRTNRKAQNLMPLVSGDSVIMFGDGSLVMDLGALIELGRGHRCWGAVRDQRWR